MDIYFLPVQYNDLPKFTEYKRYGKTCKNNYITKYIIKNEKLFSKFDVV